MVVVLVFGTLLAVLNQTLLTPALPAIMGDYSIDASTAQWLTSGYSLVEAVVIPLSAYLMGRLSTRKLFIGGISLFAVGSFVAACAPRFEVLLLGRAVQAACAGAMMPMVSSVILLIFPREKRGAAMGLIGLVIGFAPALGPTVAGLLVDYVGWRALFLIVTALAVVVALVAAWKLENVGAFEATKFDLLSVVLSTVGLVCLLYGFSSFGTAANIAVPAALVVVGLVVIGFYVKRQLSLDEPMLRLDILKTRQYRTVVIIIALFQAGLVGMGTIMPLYIQGVLGQSATVSGLTLLPGAVLAAFIGLLAGGLFDKFGIRIPTAIGCVFLVCAAAGLPLLQSTSNVIFVAIVYAFVPVGVQFTMTPLNTWGINSLANEDVRYAQSTSNTVNQVAGSFGVAALVSVSAAVTASVQPALQGVEATFAGYHASFIGTSAMLVIAILAILVFARDKKTDTEYTPKHLKTDPAEVVVAEVMNPEVVQAPATATMGDAVAIMSQADASGLSVVDSQGKLVGFVSDGDIARYLARHDIEITSALSGMVFHKDDTDVRDLLADLAGKNVMNVCVKSVISVNANTPLADACKILSDHKIKKVPVLKDSVLVGALSRRDIVRYMMSQIAKG